MDLMLPASRGKVRRKLNNQLPVYLHVGAGLEKPGNRQGKTSYR